MLLPSDTDALTACSDNPWWCEVTEEWTGSTIAAQSVDWLIGRPLVIALMITVALLIRWVAHRVIDRVFRKIGEASLPGKASAADDDARISRRVQRAQAMASLFKSVVTGVIVAIFGTMILSEFGVNVAPILASAGILGVALGFGAQSLVGDWLAGVAMIFEDQYGVGDFVDLGEAIGYVESVSLRITRVRDNNGIVWYVRNGEIMRVGNQSQNWARAVVDVTIDHDEDIHRVREIAAEVITQMWKDQRDAGTLIEEPVIQGIQDVTPDGVVFRIVARTRPMTQNTTCRELRERLAVRFHDEDIVFGPRPETPTGWIMAPEAGKDATGPAAGTEEAPRTTGKEAADA